MAEARPVGVRERVFVTVLLAAFALLAVLSMRLKSATFDETAHLAAGVSYAQLHDFRMNPEHPVLPKLLAGMAATMAGAHATDQGPAWEQAAQWDYARDLLYGQGVDSRRLLFAGRLPTVLAGLLLGLLLWRWTRAMIGPAAAAAALTLYALSPNVLAHTRLVTTDVPLTLTVVAVAACLWQAWRTGRIGWSVAGGACAAASMLTKFSAFSYAPAWAVLLLLPSAARPFRAGLRHLAAFAVAAFVLTELFVFVVYGFATDFVTIRALGMEGRGVTPGAMSLLRRVPYEIMASIPWPSRHFAEGMKTIILYTEAGHPVFLAGMRGYTGWWWMPFVTLALKVTLPFQILVLAAVVALVRTPSLRCRQLLFVLLPAALVLATNMAAHLGLGIRHLLPMFPFLMILAAWPLRAGALVSTGRAVVVVALLLWHGVAAVRAFPHYLPYFHELVGGAEGGARFLGDSNLDWGQDLSLAAKRLRERGVTGAVLCYFGTASPFVEGLDWQVLPPASRGRDRDPWTVLPTEGEQWLVMSVTNLQGIYYRTADGKSDPYPWLEGVEPKEVVGGSIRLYEIGLDSEVQEGMAELYRRHGLLAEEEAALRRVLAQRPSSNEARKRLCRILEDRGDLEGASLLIRTAFNPEVEEILTASRLHEEMRDLALAEGLLRRGLKGYPGSPELHNQLAWFLQDYGGSLDDALRHANEAVQWVPDDPYYLDTRGMVYLKRGDASAALRDFEAATAKPEGQIPDILWHRVQALDRLGRHEDAQAVVDAIVVRDDVSDELLAEIADWQLSRP